MSKFLKRGISTSTAIIIIVLCTLIVGGIVVWQGSIKEDIKISKEMMPDIEVINWKIYESPEMKFFIKYPSNFILFEARQFGNVYRPDLFRAEVMSEEGVGEIDIILESWTEFGGGLNSLDDWTEREKKKRRDDPSFSEEDIIFDKTPATKISNMYSAHEPYGEGQLIIIFAQKGERMYDIRAWISSRTQDIYLPIYNHMLSTFRFIE